MKTPIPLAEKYGAILENERVLTSHVAGEVIDKPRLSLWMIMMPIFFVFYYFQFQRYKNGLRSFKRDFIRTREHVLDAALQAAANNQEINIEELVAAGNAPEQAREAYRSLIAELAAFYQTLLEAEGHDYPSLVQVSYRKKSNYLIVLNKITLLEHQLNRALLPGFDPGDERTTLAVETIEKSTANFRRSQAKEVFAR